MEELKKTKILLPLSLKTERKILVKGLAIIGGFQNPFITVFHIIELPVTAALDIKEHKLKVKEVENKLKPIVKWIEAQSFKVRIRIVVSRHISDAIVEEARIGGYDLVVLTKRKPPQGIGRILYRSHTDYVTGKIDCPALILMDRDSVD